MPDLLKLAGVLALIIVLLRLKWNLGLVLVLASALVGLLFGRAPKDLVLDAAQAIVDPTTLRLVAIILLITFMSAILRRTLQLEGLVRSLGDLFVDRRWLLALIPLLIGLLPMAGGAIFSAPMVEEASQGLDLSRERKTFANYWFRHAAETAFPLYPSLVIAAGLMAIPPTTLAVSNWPLLVAALLGGALLGLLGIRRAIPDGGSRPPARDTWLLLLKSIWPIALVLILSLALHIDLVLSLAVTVVALIAVHRLGPRPIWEMLKAMPYDLVPVVVGAMIFQHILETSGAVEAASRGLAGLGVALPVVVLAVPLLASLLTGLSVTGFAIGLPIVLPLCPPDLIGSGYSLLAFAGGYLGLVLSPVHLCLILSRTYFKASWGGTYRYLVPASLLVLVAAVAAWAARA
jgi:integral membrane protein (TIGR00529 family)